MVKRAGIVLVLLCGCTPDVASVTALPKADAGPDQTVSVGEHVTLDGSASGEVESYQWTLLARPELSEAELDDATTATPRFVADAIGFYVVALRVTRGKDTSPVDLVSIQATNEPPIATAECKPDVSCDVLHGRTAFLDARLSDDPDGDAFTFAWSQVTSDCATACPDLDGCNPSATSVAITDATTNLASFTAPETKDIDLVFRLEVADAASTSSTCLAYTVKNTAPYAGLSLTVAGKCANPASSGLDVNPTSCDEAVQFRLSGSQSGDNDGGDVLTYTWTQIDSTPLDVSAAISTPDAVQTYVTVPAFTGATYVDVTFRLTVFDGVDADTADITVRIYDA